MKGQKIGYKRGSSFEQNAERQLDQEILDRVFASGKDTILWLNESVHRYEVNFP